MSDVPDLAPAGSNQAPGAPPVETPPVQVEQQQIAPPPSMPVSEEISQAVSHLMNQSQALAAGQAALQARMEQMMTARAASPKPASADTFDDPLTAGINEIKAEIQAMKAKEEAISRAQYESQLIGNQVAHTEQIVDDLIARTPETANNRNLAEYLRNVVINGVSSVVRQNPRSHGLTPWNIREAFNNSLAIQLEIAKGFYPTTSNVTQKIDQAIATAAAGKPVVGGVQPAPGDVRRVLDDDELLQQKNQQSRRLFSGTGN